MLCVGCKGASLVQVREILLQLVGVTDCLARSHLIPVDPMAVLRIGRIRIGRQARGLGIDAAGLLPALRLVLLALRRPATSEAMRSSDHHGVEQSRDGLAEGPDQDPVAG